MRSVSSFEDGVPDRFWVVHVLWARNIQENTRTGAAIYQLNRDAPCSPRCNVFRSHLSPVPGDGAGSREPSLRPLPQEAL